MVVVLLALRTRLVVNTLTPVHKVAVRRRLLLSCRGMMRWLDLRCLQDHALTVFAAEVGYELCVLDVAFFGVQLLRQVELCLLITLLQEQLDFLVCIFHGVLLVVLLEITGLLLLILLVQHAQGLL